MGWGRTLLLGDIGNRLDIEDTERDIMRLRREMAGAFDRDMTQDQKLDALANENAELKLLVAAVVRLLTAKGVISRDELKAMVEAVDAEDGKVDGKYGGEIA